MKAFLIGCTLSSVILLICGCQKGEPRSNDYVEYVERESNGLRHTQQIGDMRFQVQYCPTEYLLIKEYKTGDLSEKVVEERRKDNEGLLFFKLRISADGSNDVLNYHLNSGEEYYARVQYLSYGFEENIALVNERDTIFPALFHFERTYGVAPFADFMMAFNTTLKTDGEFQMIIDDKVFDTGILQFTYQSRNLQNIPKLITR